MSRTIEITAFDSHWNSEGDAILVQVKIFIFALGRIDLVYCGMYVAKTCRVCIIDLLGVVGVLHIMYLVSAKPTGSFLSTKIHHQCWEGKRVISR